MRSLWFGEDIKTAIDANRLHHQLAPMEVAYEEGTDEVIFTKSLFKVTSRSFVGFFPQDSIY